MSLTRAGLVLADHLWPGEFPPRHVHVATAALADKAQSHRRLIASYAFAARGEELETRDSLRDLLQREIRSLVEALPPRVPGRPWAVEFYPDPPPGGCTVLIDDGHAFVTADDL